MNAKNQSSANVSQIKILIVGLDNSGKSSILLSLAKNTNLMSYFSLKPTHGLNIVKIREVDKTYSIWELGGQKRYRKDYFQKFGNYSERLSTLIFVIDVQDVQRYDLALEYLEDILKLLKNIENIKLSVFLHKFDPQLEGQDDFTPEKIASRLINKIMEIVPPKMDYHIFKTSVFTIFQKTMLY